MAFAVWCLNPAELSERKFAAFPCGLQDVLLESDGSPTGHLRFTMCNYFSLGVESRIGAGFERHRTASQVLNKVVGLRVVGVRVVGVRVVGLQSRSRGSALPERLSVSGAHHDDGFGAGSCVGCFSGTALRA